MVNIKLLDEVLARIDEHPANWDQSKWAVANPGEFTERKKSGEEDRFELTESCGTAFCVAGWVAVLTDQKLNWRPEHTYNESGEFVITGYVADDLVGGMRISDYARQALGISRNDADSLFHHGNSREALQDLRDNLVQARIADLEGSLERDRERLSELQETIEKEEQELAELRNDPAVREE